MDQDQLTFRKKGEALDAGGGQKDMEVEPSMEKVGSHVDKVISLEMELKMLQDDNMNPRDIYLQHCLQFAKSNFDQMTLTIEEYKIKR